METTLIHSPTLESVKRVESVIQEYNGELGKYQLWRKLPKKMMYQTFQIIINYLEELGKIILDKDGIIVWVWDPEGVKKALRRGVRVR